MRIYFIAKPLSVFTFKKLCKSIEKTFNKKKYSLHVLKTLNKGHAISLAQKAISEKADLIVACGGDGTINEVAQVLVETKIPLAIIPLGSGNGIARHFKIPFGIKKALQIIKKNNLAKMDVGVVNGSYFFGNMGCALESLFIRRYQKNKWHGIFAYVIAFFEALIVFKYNRVQIKYDKVKQEISPFVMLISNTNQQGYDFSLTPKALSDDGLIDLFFMEKSNILNIIKFLINVLMGKELDLQGCRIIRLAALKISLLSQGDFCVQIDGEYLQVVSKNLDIKILPKKLSVIIP
tara:strand:- start:19 stop:894 length:876 start_codon:yes stop_codon:yes gene_type:complete